MPTAEEGGHRTTAHRIVGPQPGHPASLGVPVLVSDPESDDSQLRVLCEQLLDLAEDVVGDEQAIVVQFDDDIDVARVAQQLKPDVATTRAAQILFQRDLGRVRHDLGEGCRIAHQNHPCRRDILLLHRSE